MSEARKKHAANVQANLMTLFGGCCFWCLRPVAPWGTSPFSDPLAPTRDHLIPVAWGGRGEQWNLVLCCSACNSRRGKELVPPADWECEEVCRVSRGHARAALVWTIAQEQHRRWRGGWFKRQKLYHRTSTHLDALCERMGMTLPKLSRWVRGHGVRAALTAPTPSLPSPAHDAPTADPSGDPTTH